MAKNKLRIAIILSVLVITFAAIKIYGQKGNVVECEIENCSYSKVYLLAVYGTENAPLDSTIISRDRFEFEMKDEYPKGMYKLLLNETNYISFVYNNESVSLKIANDLDIETLTVNESTENEVFYKYLKREFTFSDQMNEIINLAQTYYAEDAKANKKKIDSLRNLIHEIDEDKRNFSLKLANKNPNLFTSKIIRAMQVPSYAEFKKKNKDDRYGSEMDYLSIHYFDYIDFSDTGLLHTEVIYRSFSTYLKNFARPANTQGLIRASDMMLAKAAANLKFYDYVLELLIGTFEDTEWTGVYTYLVKNHLPQDTLKTGWAKKAKEKAEVFMKLTLGNKAPQIIGVDVKGKNVNLHEMDFMACLVIFWSADCDHCVHTMPGVKKLIDKHKGKVSAIAISVDADQMLWRETIKKQELMNWYHIIAPEGLESEILQSYNISVTPTFFLLDRNKQIISSPMDISELEKDLNENLKN